MKKLLMLTTLLVMLAIPAIAQDSGEINKKETYQNLVLYPSIGINTRMLTMVRIQAIQVKTYLNTTKVILTVEQAWESGLHENVNYEVELNAGTDYYNENVIEGQVY